MKSLEWSQHFFHYNSMGIFPDTQWQLTPQSEVSSGRISDPSRLYGCPCYQQEWRRSNKKKGARVVTTLSIDLSDAQGQLTQKSVMESYQYSDSSKLLLLSLLPAWMKKIHLKMKALEWSQHFFHHKSMGIFPDAQGQLTPQFLVVSCQISNQFEILWLYSLAASIKKNLSKMKELSVAMETRVLIWFSPKPNLANSSPQ